jgi:hypothetical protein
MMRSTATVTPNTKSPLSVPSSIADEHGLEVLLPIASNTEGLRQSLSIDHFIKKMSDGGNEISESALAQGFSWQPKAPILPGQFYKRPQQLVENAPEISKHNRSPGTSNAASRSRNTSAKSHYTQSPLKLSEFFFDENRECSDNLPKTVLDSAKVTPPRDAGPNCSLTADDNTESPQEVSISFSSKGVDHSASYQWPRNISGDIQSTDGGSPRGAIVNDKGNIQDMRVNRTIRHTVASRDQNSSAHVDKMSPHTRGIRNARRHASPTSVCGDLEGLVHQEERRGVRQLYENVGSSSHQSRHIRLFDGSQRAHRRSHSRVSNISRKRSATHKHRRLHDSDRKLTMMLKVAEQWNECIQTAEEEKEEAMNEMDRLQAVLLRQYKLLEETQASLRDERAEVQKMKDQCSEFQEREVGAHKEKLKLSNEIESLRNDLEDSQKRVGKWGEKFKTKINEVISEQNDLHQRSHGYYEIVLKELQETEKKRSSETDAIKKAIALSQEKRKEMALVLEESQLQSQRDLEFSGSVQMM